MGTSMKPKHILRFMRQCLALATNSPCPRAQFGAIIVDPESNRNLSEGWNGAPKGDFELCGDRVCLREVRNIESGRETETGCHHAEANALTNACAEGVATKGKWIFVNGAPCLSCAKLIHHADIACVVMGRTVRNTEGLDYLEQHEVPLMKVEILIDGQLKIYDN